MRGQKMSKESRPLTLRQKKFGRYYVECGNATQAAIKAGYSPVDAGRHGFRLLRNPGVKRQIGRLMHSEVERQKQQMDLAYQETNYALTRRATDFIDKETGGFVPIHELPERANASIESIEIDDRLDEEGNVVGRKTKLKLVSKLGAIKEAFSVRGAYAPTGGNTTINVDNRSVLILPENGRESTAIESH